MARLATVLVVAAVSLCAQVARADWNDGYHDARPVHGRRGCGPRPAYAPQGASFQTGRYELQNVQVWVPGVQQQVWVPGSCGEGRGRHRRPWRGCSPGGYRTVWTAGHYETTQQWVWVAFSGQHPYQQQYQQQQYGQYSQYEYQQQFDSSGF